VIRILAFNRGIDEAADAIIRMAAGRL